MSNSNPPRGEEFFGKLACWVLTARCPVTDHYLTVGPQGNSADTPNLFSINSNAGYPIVPEAAETEQGADRD